MPIRQTIAALSAIALLAGCGGPAPAAPQAADGATVTQAPMPDIGAATTAAADPQPPAGAPVTPPPPPADPLAVGSQAAKDELYCSALIYAENPDVPNALAPIDEALLRKAQALGFIIGESGINRLVEEKAAHATHARLISDAYMAQVEKDLKAKKPRISLDDCNKRAAAIPMPQ